MKKLFILFVLITSILATHQFFAGIYDIPSTAAPTTSRSMSATTAPSRSMSATTAPGTSGMTATEAETTEEMESTTAKPASY